MRAAALRQLVGVLTLFTALVTATAINPSAAGDEPCVSATDCSDDFRLRTGGVIRYYRSLPLTANPAVRRAVIVIHGKDRNADEYYGYAIAAAKLEQRLDDSLVLAPHFLTRADRPAANEHYWSSSGWPIGNRSQDPRRVSSFAVLDELLASICPAGPGSFPNLRTVVLIGHSAGGQFVNRYVAGGAGCPDRSVQLRHVVMNPSSYLYVDGRRRATTSAPFEVPRFGCETFDEYKYGLGDLNAYLETVGPGDIRRRLFTRPTWYLAGEDDTRSDKNLDTGCEARLQGANRLARHVTYRDYAALFPDWTATTFVTVPRIGHSGRKMLSSEVARSITFR